MTEHICLQFDAGNTTAAQLGLGAAALRYAGMGYAVIPLARARKQPHGMLPEAPDRHGGVWWATRDPQQIISWWSQDPAAGVGIACGQASQLMVIDLDVKKGVDGRGEFGRFLSRYGLDLPTGFPVAITPSGGQHLWFRTPAGWPVGQRNGIIPAVDIKGDGGYVAAAPTMIMIPTLDRPGESGEMVLLPYSWAFGCPCSVPLVPEWVFKWIRSAPPSHAGDDPAGPAVDLGALRENGLQVGARNTGLYLLLCSLYGRYGTGPEGEAAVDSALPDVLNKTDTKGFDREIPVIRASARAFIVRSRERDSGAMEGVIQWLNR